MSPICLTRTLRWFAITWLPLIALVGLAGCENPSPVTTSDPAACKELLESALDSWQSGSTAADLKSRATPLYVADEQWDRGVRLLAYKLDGDGQVHGTNVQFQARLTTSDAQGRKSEQVVRYLVTNTPAQTIARESL